MSDLYTNPILRFYLLMSLKHVILNNIDFVIALSNKGKRGIIISQSLPDATASTTTSA